VCWDRFSLLTLVDVPIVVVLGVFEVLSLVDGGEGSCGKRESRPLPCMLQANDFRHTLSNAVNQSEPLADSDKCLLEARHVFLNGIFDFFVAAVGSAPAFVERVHAFVLCLFGLVLSHVVLMDVDCLCMTQ